MLLYVRRSSLFGTTQCTQGFGSVKNHLPRWRQMSLVGKWVCKASESARHVSLPSKWGCQASESAGQGSLPVACQEASLTAKQTALCVRQDISRRGHQCRKPDTQGLQLSISTPSSVPPGIWTHVSSGSGVRSTKGLGNLVKIVWVSTGFFTILLEFTAQLLYYCFFK